MDQGHISSESSDGVLTIRIDRPERRNAIDKNMATTLEEIWNLYEDGEDRVAVITGTGDFTAGLDVRNPPEYPSWIPGLGRVITKPVIAAIDGWCIAGGVILLNHVDLAIVSDRARFRYPEAHMGVSRGLAAGIAGRIPYKAAMEILLMGGEFDAEFALRVGLCNRVVAADELDGTVHAWAKNIAAADPDCVSFLKASVLDTIPAGEGEKAARHRWTASNLPGNRRLLSGGISLSDAKASHRLSAAPAR